MFLMGVNDDELPPQCRNLSQRKGKKASIKFCPLKICEKLWKLQNFIDISGRVLYNDRACRILQPIPGWEGCDGSILFGTSS